MDKIMSAGFVLMDGDNRLLMCHPTGKPKKEGFWDIPKGCVEYGDLPLEAALRELEEETGIELTEAELNRCMEDCGTYSYGPYKDLHVFVARWGDMHNAALVRQGKLKCKSKFELDGRKVPEMNDYMMSDDLSMLYKSLQPIVSDIIKKCSVK